MLFELDVETDAAQKIARFRLKNEAGQLLAANRVKLDDHSPLLWEGLFDTRRHVRRDLGNLILDGQAEPATADQLLERLGVFLGEHVLGPEITAKLLVTQQHRTLLVRLPDATDPLAAAMARVPWEIARPGPGEPPLMSRSLVVRAAARESRPVTPEPGRDVVRVLLVFAEAPGSRPLAMRLERENLLRLFFDEILSQRRVEVDVLCHGVTRGRLVEQVKARGGYEVVHWSGHGHHNLLELRGEGGTADRLSGPDLVHLFTGEAGGFIPRLFFLSACLSGTLITVKDWASFRAAMEGHEPADDAKKAGADVEEVLEEQPGYTGTALELLRAGVPQVVAMRYEVGDAYARDLAHHFYKHLLADPANHPADTALALARGELLQANEASSYYAVDHATPLIFGEPGRIEAEDEESDQLDRRWPRPQPLLSGGRKELDPRQPAAFVGRSKELTRLAESWLPREKPGVAVVQGMAGMGKTSIASEAINLWHPRFKWVFAFQAKPTRLELDEFHRDLHQRLSLHSEPYRKRCARSPYESIYLDIEASLTGPARYEKMRQNLVQALRRESILLVLDNYETNLEDDPRDGGYASQDPEWDHLLSALADALPPTGSRLLVTTRHQPRALAGDGVLRLPLGPLSLAEAALFLRNHDTLRRLHASGESGAALVMRLMDTSRGHPLILDRLSALADDSPSLSQALDTLKDRGLQALPDLFHSEKSDEESTREHAYLEDVAVGSVDLLLRRVSPDARRLLWVITQANEPVSEGFLEGVWAGKSVQDEELEQFRATLRFAEQHPEEMGDWLSSLPPEFRQLLEQADAGPQAPPVGPLLEELCAAGLLTVEQPDGPGQDASSPPAELQAIVGMLLSQVGGGTTYAFHELVRERVAAWMTEHPTERGDRTPEQIWVAYGERYVTAFQQFIRLGGEGSRDRAAEAGRRALSYLVRARDFDRLNSFASGFITGTNDPELLRQVIAELRAVADEVPPGKARWSLRTYLADAMSQAGRPDEALDLYARVATDAEAAEHWDDLGTIYGNWAIALNGAGRLDDSRTMHQRSAEAERKAGRPSVYVVGSELEALRVDVMQGHTGRALPEIDRHLETLRGWWRSHREGHTVPDAPDPEFLGRALVSGLDIAYSANLSLERWQPCLDLLKESETILWERGENEHEQARARANQYGPLLRLGQIEEAQRVLESCLDVFRNANDLAGQAKALSALADVWDERGDVGQAVAAERRALAVSNNLPDPEGRAISHNNLSGYFHKVEQLEESARHRLAAVAYLVVTGHQAALATSLRNLAIRIRRAAQSGQTSHELPRLADLLARPEFDALKRFLAQFNVDLDGLQTKIDGLVEQTRQQALAPEALAQDAAAEAVQQLLQQLAQAAASGQDIAPLLDGLREQLLLIDPGNAEEIDANLAGLRAALLGAERSVEEPERSTDVEVPAETREVAVKEGTRLYTVWYGTNRKPVDPGDHAKGYSGEREAAGVVHYGSCEVAIPKWHRFGSVGSSWWRRWVTGKDDRLFVARREAMAEGAFWEGVRRAIGGGEPDERQAVVYLHGYNVAFDAAAIRAAQIGFDLKVPGAMGFFSWPSRGALDGYAADAASIEASEDAIREFLVRFAAESGADRVHLIAHSMGNRGLLRAVQRIAADAAAAAGVRFGQVFLAAPDVDVDTFRDLARLYPTLTDRTTLYVSSRDRAVEASYWLHQFHRVGYTPPVTVVDGIDTVEVGNIDLTTLGHSYFAEAEGVLYDMFQLLRHNAPPSGRQRLQEMATPDGRLYWSIAT